MKKILPRVVTAVVLIIVVIGLFEVFTSNKAIPKAETTYSPSPSPTKIDCKDLNNYPQCTHPNDAKGA
jgi:hypothetical protein